MSAADRNVRELLDRADDRLIMLGVEDSTSQIAQGIARIGLGRIHSLQEHLGLEPDACYLLGPDVSPSRNSDRSLAGFVVGSKLSWGTTNSTPLVPLGFGANACGLCVVGLDDMPDASDVRRRLYEVNTSEPGKATAPAIEDVPIIFDFARRNHFLEVFEVEQIFDQNLFDSSIGTRYVGILHCSAPELKVTSKFGFGLQLAESAELRSMAQYYNSPLGIVPYLYGESAEKYFQLTQYAERFAAQKRSLIAQIIFPGCRVISDAVHHNLGSLNEALMGAQRFAENPYYSFLLGPNTPSFLVQALNVSDLQQQSGRQTTDVLEDEPTARAQSSFIPHSGGYSLPFVKRARVEAAVGAAGMVIELETHVGNIMEAPSTADLPYDFRGESVLARTESLGLCRRLASIIPRQCYRV